MDPLPPALAPFLDALAPEYRIVRVLGTGGMATVLLAEELALKREVAIKVLDPALAQEQSARARFRREAEAAASLSHPNIVPIHRVGEAADLPYMVMQYVRGGTLAERLAREGKLPIADSLRVAREVAEALRAAHRRGVVHRDVKPQNVLIDAEDGRALVADFGIARLLTPEVADDPKLTEALTGVGNAIGTPRYMSPEQAGAQPVGPASDLYSLGIVLYEMLAGASPYAATPGRSAMVQHLLDPVVPLTRKRPEVSAEVVAVTERLLAKEPKERFASAEALLEALDASSGARDAVAVGSAAAPASGAPLAGSPFAPAAPGGRRRSGLLGAVLAAVVLVAGAAWFLTRGGTAAEDPRQSLLVGYFDNTARDPDLDWLRVGGVELLNRSLARWTDIRLVETTRLLDLARRADLAEDGIMSQADVLGLAREAGAGTAALGSILRLGSDRSSVTLRLYDVQSGDALGQFSREIAADSLLPDAFAALADEVLQVAGVPNGAVPAGEPPTRSLAAFRAYVDGLRALHRWEVDSARAALETAVSIDAEFALAWMRMGETAFFREGPFFLDSAPWEPLLDSAMAHVSNRPERERLLVETSHDFMYGRFASTRENARRLLALDSTSVDGWFYLGSASYLDQFVVPNAAGEDSTGFDPTTALHALRRAVALDASIHPPYLPLGVLLLTVAREQISPPTGYLGLIRGQQNGLRTPAFDGGVWAQRLVMVTPDSLAFGPLNEMNARLSPAAAATSLRLAQEALRAHTDRWLAIAPDEGMAHAAMSQLQEVDGDWSGALASFDRSLALGAPSMPFDPDFQRLYIALSGQLDSVIFATTSRLEATSRDALPPNGGGYLLGSLGAAQLLQGRVAAASATRAQAQSLANTGPRMTARARAMMAYSGALFNAQVRSHPGQLSEADLGAHEAAFRSAVAALPDSLQTRTSVAALVPLGFPAAYLGDTARLSQLREALPRQSRALYPGLDALAAAVAGDRAGTEAALRAVDADTLFPWPGSAYAGGAAALLIGDPATALRHFSRVDSSAFTIYSPALDPDWIFVPRAAKGRGDAALALGDTARAISEYERVLRLWENADPVFDAERRDVEARLARIAPGDRPRVISVPPGR